jgi:LysR family transcriptional activator of nhaA
MPELNYHHLRYFHAIAHSGGLTRAATALNLAPSALSAQLRALEARLGHALFQRRGRQLHLTEAGRIALAHADAIFAGGAELLATLRRTGAAQVLRVGALATLSRNFQLAVLRPVLGRPGIEVILRAGGQRELLDALVALELDMVLTTVPPPDQRPSFLVRKLAEQPISLVAPPGVLDRSAPLPAQLMARPLILPAHDSGVRAQIDQLLAGLGLSPVIAAEVDDMAMMRLLAREGIGVAVLPPIVVRDELAAGTLEEGRRLDGVVQPFHAVMVKRRFPNPLVAEVLAVTPPEAPSAAPAADGGSGTRTDRPPRARARARR